MVSGSTICGDGLCRPMTEAGGSVKGISPGPPAALAPWIACRRLPGPESSVLVTVTVKVAGRGHDTRADHPADHPREPGTALMEVGRRHERRIARVDGWRARPRPVGDREPAIVDLGGTRPEAPGLATSGLLGGRRP
jgi:hypothetical protein